MRYLVAIVVATLTLPVVAQSYGNAGYNSGAYGNAGYNAGAYGNAGYNSGAYGNGGYGVPARVNQGYYGYPVAPGGYYAVPAVPYDDGGYMHDDEGYARQNFAGRSSRYRYSPFQAENGDFRNYDNDFDGRLEPTHVQGHYRRSGAYTRGHYRALPR
jgi:hypothetical protein